MSNAIETHGLRYRAGKTFEIRDLALNVPTGAVYGFLGPNGSGKTTTIRLLLGMLRRTGGTIRVLDGSVPRDIVHILTRVGYVPERPHLYPSLSVAEALRFHGAFFSGWDGRWADELRGGFGLDQDAKLSRLSKGEMGKLLVLVALAQRPDLLILDEPTDGLDPVVRRDVLAAVLAYVSTARATVFISSHLVHELERICDWVGVMDHGALVAELPMQTFKNGIKRLRVRNAPADVGDAPFVVLAREAGNGIAGESWVVRGWDASMHEYFTAIGAAVHAVDDLDLEDGFVELLRASRAPTA